MVIGSCKGNRPANTWNGDTATARHPNSAASYLSSCVDSESLASSLKLEAVAHTYCRSYMRALMLPISGLMSANFHSEDEQARLRDDILLTADGPASTC